MKIYFTASVVKISKERESLYAQIIGSMKKMGHTVYSVAVSQETQELLKSKDEKKINVVHRKTLSRKHQANIVVAEVSSESVALGQEISYSLNNNIPVIALYGKGKLPNILHALGSEYLHIVEYSLDTLDQVLDDYIEYAKETADTRFNFFISSEIDSFLDWISKKRKVPRAVFLRELIEEDMKKNSRYLKEIGSK